MRSIPGIQKTAAFGKTKLLGIFVLTVMLVLAGLSFSTRADTLDLSTPDHLQHEIDKLSATIGQFENRMHSEGEPLPDPSKATAGEKLAKDAGKLFKKAEIAFLAGRDQLAIKEFKTLLFSHPGNELGAVAQIRLAQLYLERQVASPPAPGCHKNKPRSGGSPSRYPDPAVTRRSVPAYI